MSYLTLWEGKHLENSIDCKIDNLVIYVEDIRMHAFEMFKKRLEVAEYKGQIPRLRFHIGTAYSDYHYRLHVGEGGGAIAIGFKHNSCSSQDEFFRMRVEFNPQKNGEAFRGFWVVFNTFFYEFTRKIKQFDIAFDVPVPIDRVHCVSLTGRQKGYFKGTKYFGSPGNHGRMKIYDKKKELEEKQKIEIDEEITRIEYTARFEEPMTVQWLSKVDNFGINEQYQISIFNEEKLTGELKACVLALHHELVEFKEFTRTTKKKIKNALSSMGQLDLDHAYKSALKKNVQTITSYFSIT